MSDGDNVGDGDKGETGAFVVHGEGEHAMLVWDLEQRRVDGFGGGVGAMVQVQALVWVKHDELELDDVHVGLRVVWDPRVRAGVVFR